MTCDPTLDRTEDPLYIHKILPQYGVLRKKNLGVSLTNDSMNVLILLFSVRTSSSRPGLHGTSTTSLPSPEPPSSLHSRVVESVVSNRLPENKKVVNDFLSLGRPLLNRTCSEGTN